MMLTLAGIVSVYHGPCSRLSLYPLRPRNPVDKRTNPVLWAHAEIRKTSGKVSGRSLAQVVKVDARALLSACSRKPARWYSLPSPPESHQNKVPSGWRR